MNQEQIKTLREKFAARDCENQVEFETWMTDINAVQHALIDPFDKKIGEMNQRKANLFTQRSAINIQLDQLKQERVAVEQERRDICAIFHELKHAMIERNPREKFIKVEPAGEQGDTMVPAYE